jgi:hypothetical protein
MVGERVYDRFVALVRERERRRTTAVALPHPAVRRRGTGSRKGASGVAEGTVESGALAGG